MIPQGHSNTAPSRRHHINIEIELIFVFQHDIQFSQHRAQQFFSAAIFTLDHGPSFLRGD
jgi:hypothetical protein